MDRCAWCSKRIHEDSKVFALGVKTYKGVDFKEHEGKIIQLFLAASDKNVPAIVVTSDSKAKRQGKDLVFALCSRECGDSLKNALKEEKDFLESDLDEF